MYFSPEHNTRLATKLFGHVRNGTTDLADGVFEYDLDIYSDPALAAREREFIFERLPMMAAHSAQIAEPGSFVTMRLNRSNIILTRLKTGEVRALLNVCRHRGSTVVSQPCGRRSLFTCPYHGWTYSNDGTLRAISFGETFGVSPSAERNLLTLPVEERHGFIWVVENPSGTIDVAAHLGPAMDHVLAAYGFDKYFCYKEQVFDFPQNWKIMMDGLIDGYHVQFLHGKTISPYFYPNMNFVDIHGDHAVFGTPRRSIEKILDEQPGDSPLDRYVAFGNMFAPNSVMVLHPHHIEYWTIYQDPEDVTRSRAHLRYLTPREVYDEQGQEILAKNWNIATAAIINEDVPAGNGIQASAKVPRVGTVCLGRNEVTNQLFHRTYRRYVNG